MTMKIAICLSGYTKNYKNSLWSIENRFKDHEIDTYCVTYDSDNVDEILKNYNPKNKLIVDKNLADQMLRIDHIEIMSIPGITVYLNQFMHPQPDPLSIPSMFFGMLLVNNLRKEMNEYYDLVVRMRYDTILFECEKFEAYDLSKINIPAGADNDGINDQFAFGPLNSMDQYFNVYPNIIRYAQKCKRYRAEPILYEHLLESGLLNMIDRPIIGAAISAR